VKVLHLEYDAYPKEAIRKLDEIFHVEGFDCSNQEELYDKLARDEYDIIFARLGLMIDAKAISLQPSLKFIVTSTTGLNHIDVAAAQNADVRVVSLKGEHEFLANVKSTAEHAWGLLLSLIRSLPSAISHVLNRGWDRKPFLSDELDGKTIGIIGYGRLGKIVAGYAKAFGMNVLTFDRKLDADTSIHNVRFVSIDELLDRADVVMLLISWSEENKNFMSVEKFAKMKAGSYFINPSRGELVDEKALLDALKSRRLKGAALDVLRDDSSWPGKYLGTEELLQYALANTNLLITPHMGGYGKDSIAKTRSFVTDKLISLVSI
jgi:D-3-phosphoglycerate dehydrogenase / 2-oxoglutarate reductase